MNLQVNLLIFKIYRSLPLPFPIGFIIPIFAIGLSVFVGTLYLGINLGFISEDPHFFGWPITIMAYAFAAFAIALILTIDKFEITDNGIYFPERTISMALKRKRNFIPFTNIENIIFFTLDNQKQMHTDLIYANNKSNSIQEKERIIDNIVEFELVTIGYNLTRNKSLSMVLIGKKRWKTNLKKLVKLYTPMVEK